MAQSLSALRAQLLDLTESIQRLRQTFLDREPLLPGSVYTLKRRCGKPNCRCVKGQLHHTEVLSYRGGGRPQNITPRPGELEAFKQWTDGYRRFRQARAQLVKLQKQMMELIDRIEAERVRQGEGKFRALRRRACQFKPKP
jgi:hypothetical protein